jgi:hypothetical protein
MSETPTASGDPTTRTEREDGFEFDGAFYRFHVSDIGKDLLLIDRFTGLPPHEFFEAVESRSIFDLMRAPMLLALVSTSLRAAHPDWSVERIHRLVSEKPFGEIEWIFGDEEEGVAVDGPPSSTAEEESTSSSSAESSPSPTPPEPSASET